MVFLRSNQGLQRPRAAAALRQGLGRLRSAAAAAVSGDHPPGPGGHAGGASAPGIPRDPPGVGDSAIGKTIGKTMGTYGGFMRFEIGYFLAISMVRPWNGG